MLMYTCDVKPEEIPISSYFRGFFSIKAIFLTTMSLYWYYLYVKLRRMRTVRILCHWKALALILLVLLLIKVIFQSGNILRHDCCQNDRQMFILPGRESWKLANHLYDWDEPTWSPHKLAVIVPFRDCFDELQQFVPHIHQYLKRKRIRHKIYVVNQVDNLRFNRASLIDIGFLQSEAECDYMVMHDIDLLPLNEDLYYGFPHTGVFHISPSGLHPTYNYTEFVGGILMLQNHHFRQVNGMSTKYWGWGREDDDLYVRMKRAEFHIEKSQGIKTGLKTFKETHNVFRRSRDKARYHNQAEDCFNPEFTTGLDTIQYDVISTVNILVNASPVTIINVQLKCDLKVTPWCVTPEQYKNMTAT